MPKDQSIAELRAAAASLMTAIAAAENGEWSATEIALEDAHSRTGGLLRELSQLDYASSEATSMPAGRSSGLHLVGPRR